MRGGGGGVTLGWLPRLPGQRGPTEAGGAGDVREADVPAPVPPSAGRAAGPARPPLRRSGPPLRRGGPQRTLRASCFRRPAPKDQRFYEV